MSADPTVEPVPTTADIERRPRDAGVAVGGLLALAITTVAAGTGDPTTFELEVFRFVNGWPDWLETPFWIVMQAGSAAAILLVAAAALAIWRNVRLAVAVFAAGASAWLLAKFIKETVGRGRPRVFIDDVIERPEWEGLGFVSGHAAVVFAIATVVSPYLRGGWRWLLWTVAVATAVLRMYTGAHLPLDVIGGAALGVTLGAVVNLAVGVPAAHRAPTEPAGAPGRSP